MLPHCRMNSSLQLELQTGACNPDRTPLTAGLAFGDEACILPVGPSNLRLAPLFLQCGGSAHLHKRLCARLDDEVVDRRFHVHELVHLVHIAALRRPLHGAARREWRACARIAMRSSMHTSIVR